jgi:Kef-type K+ transport system membrane component KefB
MSELLPFFLLLFTGLFFSEIFRKLHLPWVLSLILGGIVIGPFGLNLFTPNETAEFFGRIGLIFLMFMAGLELRLSSLKEYRKEIGWFALANSMIPMVVGFGIGWMFGYQLAAAVLLGIIFISSSVAVIVPSLEDRGIINTKLGRMIVGATIIEDVASLLMLSVFLQSTARSSSLPLPLYYLLLVASLWFLRWVVGQLKPKLHFRKFKIFHRGDDFHEHEFQKAFALLIGIVIVFELLGMHSIIAGFFAGLILSETIESNILKQKLHAISYGLFIPIFFLIVGSRTDLSVFLQSGNALILSAAIVIGSIGAKLVSGMLGSLFSGFSLQESRLAGFATIPQLSTTLAVVFSGFELGLLSQELVTSMVLLSVVTTFLGPIMISRVRV